MKRKISKLEKIELFGERTEAHELPKGKLGLVFCKECNSAYYKKSWHHNLRHLKKLRDNLPIKFAICPACKMIKNKQFEGQIEIKNIPLKISKDLVNLVNSFCQRAYQRDPMDRLISINQPKNQPARQRPACPPASSLAGEVRREPQAMAGGHKSAALVITTTENQLAVKLAKKIKQTFKKVEMKISYSSAPSDVVYVKLVFKI